MVLSGGMREGKEIPWFLTESRKALQKASALPKSENVGGYEKGVVFHSGKKRRWEKGWGTIVRL